MKEKLYQIDNILMRLEDYIHGKDGDDITIARNNLMELLKTIDATEKSESKNLKQAHVIKSVCHCKNPEPFTEPNLREYCWKCDKRIEQTVL
jgi:hypothetical protein